MAEGLLQPEEGEALQVAGGTDNTTVVACVNKNHSRSLELCKVMIPLVRGAKSHWVLLSSFFLPKAQMDSTSCDLNSRRRSGLWERGLPELIFLNMLTSLGRDPTEPVLDLMACRQTAKSQFFVSWRADHAAQWTDALSPASHPWRRPWTPQHEPPDGRVPPQALPYAFVGPGLIERVLERILRDGTESILVVTPLFSHSRLHLFFRLLTVPPLMIPISSAELVPPEGRVIADPVADRRVTLVAGILSGNVHGDGAYAQVWRRAP